MDTLGEYEDGMQNELEAYKIFSDNKDFRAEFVKDTMAFQYDYYNMGPGDFDEWWLSNMQKEGTSEKE